MRAQERHRRRVNREFDPLITSVSSRWCRKQRIIVDRQQTRYFKTKHRRRTVSSKPEGVNWLLNTSIHVDARFTRPVEEWLWHTRRRRFYSQCNTRSGEEQIDTFSLLLNGSTIQFEVILPRLFFYIKTRYVRMSASSAGGNESMRL